MASLEMGKAYPLTTENVNLYVEEKIGNYAFGKSIDTGWRVLYVGRSDSQLCAEIKQQANLHKMLDVNGYEFKFSYANNITKAYEKECQNYHDFKNSPYLQNKEHPAKPKDNGHYRCPIIDCKYHVD